MKKIVLILFSLGLVGIVMGAERAFTPTDPGEFEIKTLPAGRLLETQSDQPYFSGSNGLFMPLFRYIQEHRISMTTPVEAKMDPGKMYFWVAEEQTERAKADWRGVRVVDVPERTVAVLGAKGAYTENNYEKAKLALVDWLAKQEGVVAVGDPYGVFWDGPFKPWFMKSFEVHVEVDLISQKTI